MGVESSFTEVRHQIFGSGVACHYCDGSLTLTPQEGSADLRMIFFIFVKVSAIDICIRMLS